MTQHEYIFVTVSIVIGLAITRLLHVIGDLIRYHRRVKFHWSTALWGMSVMTFILQLWWIGWGLRNFDGWLFFHFLILILASICIYGAAEMALPDPDDGQFDMLEHSQSLGRFSAMSMLVYFLIGPYVNIFMFQNPVELSIAIPAAGIVLMILVIAVPRWFKGVSIIFGLYSMAVLYLTA
ncbi:Uncharacterised protein [Halioglobus japonicus]|nr:Uncharacterised protein [Halioglobus japonicus]